MRNGPKSGDGVGPRLKSNKRERLESACEKWMMKYLSDFVAVLSNSCLKQQGSRGR